MEALQTGKEVIMDISNISSMYTEYLSNQDTSATKLNNTIQNKDYKNATDDELMEACKQFEAYFLEQVFKEMQKTVDCFKAEGSESDPNTTLVDYFKDNMTQELAATSTDIQGLGLAQTLYEQMKRNYNV